jgi:hypothetical protein
MKKVVMFFCSLLVFSITNAQTIEDVQVQPVYSLVRVLAHQTLPLIFGEKLPIICKG